MSPDIRIRSPDNRDAQSWCNIPMLVLFISVRAALYANRPASEKHRPVQAHWKTGFRESE